MIEDGLVLYVIETIVDHTILFSRIVRQKWCIILINSQQYKLKQKGRSASTERGATTSMTERSLISIPHLQSSPSEAGAWSDGGSHSVSQVNSFMKQALKMSTLHLIDCRRGPPFLSGPCSSADTFAQRRPAISLPIKHGTGSRKLETFREPDQMARKGDEDDGEQHIVPASEKPFPRKQRKQNRNCKHERAEYAFFIKEYRSGLFFVGYTWSYLWKSCSTTS